jgi:hypothetical protein
LKKLKKCFNILFDVFFLKNKECPIVNRLLGVMFLFSLCFMSQLSAQTTYVAEKSGYTTTTQVVGTRYTFKRHVFLEKDFDVWLDVLYQAQAFEAFQTFIRDKKITPQGYVLVDGLTIGSKTFTRHTILDIETIKEALPKTYTGASLILGLTAAQALDNQGQIIGIDTATTLENANFSFLYPKLKSLNIPLESDKLRASLVNDLSALIISYHNQQEVTTQDQTRYQSRNDNIFTGLMESMLGNAMASWMQPDKTKVSTIQSLALPQSEPSLFYPINVGISPYYHQQNGLWSINGSSSIYQAHFTTLSSQSHKTIEGAIAFDWLFNPNIPYRKGFMYVSTALDYAQVQTISSTAVRRYMSIAIPFLSTGMIAKGGSSRFVFGPTLFNNPAGNALGMIVGFETETTFLKDFTFDAAAKYYFQPQLNSSNRWDQAHATIGFSYFVNPQLALQVGYQWWMSSTDANTDGLSLGGKFLF